jgi:mannose-6-phosphate isomerase-like protein (cupin superfamily)
LKDTKKYIESGILEEYCLGFLDEAEQAELIQMTTLYPEVKEALHAVEQKMEELAVSSAVEPSSNVRQKILATLGFAEESTEPDLHNLSPINKNADHEHWLNVLDHLIPEKPSKDFSCEVIREDDRFRQMLVVTKVDVPEEEHEDYLESFLILKGYCECTIGNEFFKLQAGDFLEIPLHVKHNIKVTSPYVVAILQYEFVES